VTEQRLCRVAEMPQHGARGFRFGSGTDRRAVLVVRQADALYGYVNSCPHQGTPLDFLPDRFLDREGRHLLCSTHGARFRVADGFCIDGPCAGKSLERIGLRVEEGEILMVTP
jgi:nitrite reductase/ring-hydroxylating ferredoxin subunit